MIVAMRIGLLFGLVLVTAAHAEIYELPPEGHDVIGALSTVTARYEDTLLSLIHI